MSRPQRQSVQQLMFDPFAPGVPHRLTYQPGPSSNQHGTCPAGSLTIKAKSFLCPGFSASTTTLELFFDIPPGTQQAYHPCPGVPHGGTQRGAYLPDNAEGRHLLVRMKIAFLRGFTFKIGRSLTTQLDHQVCWTEIPHRTGLHGHTPFCFPDANYIPNAHAELDRLGIPNATMCDAILQQQLQGSGLSMPMHLPPASYSAPTTAHTTRLLTCSRRSTVTPSLNETLTYTAPDTLSASYQRY